MFSFCPQTGTCSSAGRQPDTRWGLEVCNTKVEQINHFGLAQPSARFRFGPVLGQHRQALQQDGHHGLVQVRSGGQSLQVHLLLQHLLCTRLLALHRPLWGKACWESAYTRSVCVCVCLRYLDVLRQAVLCVRVFRHLKNW